jgi:hypothetical protein
MRARPLAACLPLVLPLVAALASPAAAQTFVFHLRGDQEVPPVPSAASGGCMATFDGVSALDVTCVHDVAFATLMHVHRGAPGVNGPIVFDLGDPASPVHAVWTGMTAGDVSDLVAGNLYVNVHTAGRPGGEIRGQVLPRTVDLVAFSLDGSQVVPPNGSSSSGSCTADLDAPATGLAIQCTHDVPAPTSAHVHEAPAGQVGPIVFTFASPASPLNANVPMTPQLVADFAATFLYLDVHLTPASEGDPSDEIRGQIGTPPAPPTTGTLRIVKQSHPGGGTGFAFTDDVPGSGAFLLADGGVHEVAGVAPGTYTVTEQDPQAVPGGWALTEVACDDADSIGDPFARTATIGLQAGEVVTCRFVNFATAPSDTLFVFHLDGGQEVPPVPSPAAGGCMGRFDAGTSRLSLVCVHDVASATLMHVHRAAAGANGPIVFDLGSPTSPVQATWSGMTPADVADLFAGNLYVNVHASGRPAGEIRGQLLPRTVDAVSFALEGSQVVPPDPSPATGSCTADLADDATTLAVACSHGVTAPTAAHLHEGPAGTNGLVAFTFASPASPFAADVPATPRLVADFAAGFLYVDVHSTGSPGGEVRGQVEGLLGGFVPAIPALGGAGLGLLALLLAALACLALARGLAVRR